MLQSIYTQDIDSIRKELWGHQENILEKKPHNAEFKPYHLKIFQKEMESFNIKLEGKTKKREKNEYTTIVSENLEDCLQNLEKSEKTTWKKLQDFQQTKCILEFVKRKKEEENWNNDMMLKLRNFLMHKLESSELKSNMLDFNPYEKVINKIKNLEYHNDSGEFEIIKIKKVSKNTKERLLKKFG